MMKFLPTLSRYLVSALKILYEQQLAFPLIY
jgi:hypothetical protein